MICLIEHEDKLITMCNLYAPNIDDPVFFEHVFKATNEFPTENIIIGGDFNLTLNTDIDRLNSNVNNHKSAKFILQFMEDNYFRDVWRDRFPDTRRNAHGSEMPTTLHHVLISF